MSDMFDEMATSVVELDLERAKQLAHSAIRDNLPLLEVIEKGFGEGIRKVGDLWDQGEFFLPELMMGAEIMRQAVEIITPHLAETMTRKIKGTVIMATIEGDIHSIGKTIVSTMLRANGYKVIDLGADIAAEDIVAAAKEHDANLIGVSALLTTTMTGQKRVVDLAEKAGIRNTVKIMLGGAPVTRAWVDECGADGYADNAVSAVELAKKLTSPS
ncbi:MAG: B12-binding domain-containing protein [Candidatus Heimdallarchaeota archaeon]